MASLAIASFFIASFAIASFFIASFAMASFIASLAIASFAMAAFSAVVAAIAAVDNVTVASVIANAAAIFLKVFMMFPISRLDLNGAFKTMLMCASGLNLFLVSY